MSKTYCPTLGKLIRATRPGAETSPIGRILQLTAILAGLVVFSSTLFSVSNADEDNAKEEPKGRIEVSEYTFDFGYMPEGVVVVHNYIVKNIGKGVLNIVKVDPTCGCTTVPLRKAFLKPGEQTELRVSFDSRKYKGNIYKRIKVLSNDPDNGLVELFVRGIVAKLPESVQLSGPAVRFEGIDVKTREVRIKNEKVVKSALKNPFWPRTRLSFFIDAYRIYYELKGLNFIIILNIICFVVGIISLIINFAQALKSNLI